MTEDSIAERILIEILDKKYREQNSIPQNGKIRIYAPEFYPQEWTSMNYEVRIGMLKEALEKKKKLTDVQISMEEEKKQHGKQS